MEMWKKYIKNERESKKEIKWSRINNYWEESRKIWTESQYGIYEVGMKKQK